MEKKILALLKSGEFTIAYHDNGYCCLYEGKHTYDDLPDEEVASYDMSDRQGYAPDLVVLLAKALGGNVDSI